MMPLGQKVTQLDHCVVLAAFVSLPLRLLSTYTSSLQTQAKKMCERWRNCFSVVGLYLLLSITT